MTMKNNARMPLVALVAVLLTAIANAAWAQDADLATYTCRDVLLASGDERDDVILILHAYLLGEADTTTFNVLELAEATDRFLDACISDPDAQAIGTMRDAVSTDE